MAAVAAWLTAAVPYPGAAKAKAVSVAAASAGNAGNIAVCGMLMDTKVGELGTGAHVHGDYSWLGNQVRALCLRRRHARLLC